MINKSCFSLVLVLLLASKINGEPSRPNFIILLADDMGWGDLGANLPHLPSSTPFLDSLANKGVRFQDFHSSASVCTPSRAALLTGRLGLRTGVVENFVPDSVGGLPANEITLAKMLKTVGYRTAAIGKWHLGLTSGHHPLDHGFDTYLGVPYSLDMGCTTPPGFDLPPRSSCYHKFKNGTKTFSETSLPLLKDRDIVHQPVKLESLAQKYVDFGVDFIKKDRTTPFLLYTAFSHVHVPLATGKNFTSPTSGGIFSNCLKEMDWMAEELVSAAGSNNTLIWFLSDNGPWEYKCSLAGSSGLYKGVWQKIKSKGGGGSSSKTTVWEGGHRVPAFINWPTRVQALVSNALVSATDIVPTIAALAGATLPKHHIYDGVDISNDLIKGEKINGHNILLHPSNVNRKVVGQIGAVRVGQYKAVYHTGGVEGCGEEPGPFQVHNQPLIFDLAVDPEEQFPLSGGLQENVTYQANEALLKFLASVRSDNTSTVDPRVSPAVRPCCSHFLANCYCPWDEL